MAQINNLQERRQNNNLAKIVMLAADIKAYNIAEAAAMGLKVVKLEDGGYRVTDMANGKVRRKRLRDLDWFMDMERERLATTLGFPNDYYMRRIARVVRGEKTTHAYARALRYLLSTIAVEVA